MIYRPEFITNTDDFTLLQKIYNLPLLEAIHKQFGHYLSDVIPGNKIARQLTWQPVLSGKVSSRLARFTSP